MAPPSPPPTAGTVQGAAAPASDCCGDALPSYQDVLRVFFMAFLDGASMLLVCATLNAHSFTRSPSSGKKPAVFPAKARPRPTPPPRLPSSRPPRFRTESAVSAAPAATIASSEPSVPVFNSLAKPSQIVESSRLRRRRRIVLLLALVAAAVGVALVIVVVLAVRARLTGTASATTTADGATSTTGAVSSPPLVVSQTGPLPFPVATANSTTGSESTLSTSETTLSSNVAASSNANDISATTDAPTSATTSADTNTAPSTTTSSSMATTSVLIPSSQVVGSTLILLMFDDQAYAYPTASVFWKDYSGTEQFKFTQTPGQEPGGYYSYQGHIWVARSGNNNTAGALIGYYSVGAQPTQTWTYN
ncbi:hypothetical protein HK405_012258 [Cladochytrium tenue]|nr:hypothetical protein HK405_012258 [Cladochytrium tenue]